MRVLRSPVSPNAADDHDFRFLAPAAAPGAAPEREGSERPPPAGGRPRVKLPDGIEVRAFDELHDRPERWRAAVASIAAAHSTATVQVNLGGTVLVGMVGDELVV
jgi:hypothetical protein